MRRFMTVMLLCLTLTGMVLPGTASAAVTSQEWRWMVAAGEKEQAGDLEGAMELWKPLMDSLRTHDVDACGTYARKLGRALDERGRTAEAISAFEVLNECWSQLSDPSYAEGMLPDMRRLEQIRPEIRGFVARPTAPEAGRKLAKHEPAFGTLLGGALDKDPAIRGDLSKVSATYGKPYAMALVYVEWNDYPKHVALGSIWADSPSLQVAWEPNQGLSAVTDNAYLRGVARELKAYGRPVFLRFAGEMNGAWTVWHDNPALYQEKFRLVASVMRQEAPNVAMVWAPNYVGDKPMEAYYPGDDWVDWVGISAYHDPYFVGNLQGLQKDADIFYQGKRTNPLDKIKAIYQAYSPRKPIMLAETGFGWANRSPYRDESQWAAGAMERFYGYLPLVYPRLKAVAYFNVDLQQNPSIPSFSHHLLSGNPLITSTYKRATASDWYLGDVKQPAPTFWRPMEQATMTGPARVAAYVNLAGGVSRVDYLLDGRTVASARQIPWVADLDLTDLTGSHTVTIRAYDQSGQVGHERSYTFDASAIKVKLNGQYLDFDQPPVLVNSRVLVPVRGILENLGAEMAWDGPTQTVTAVRNGSVLKLQIGNSVPVKDGVPQKELDVPAQLIGGRTLVPARFIAENYDMVVTWDQATQTVNITNKP